MYDGIIDCTRIPQISDSLNATTNIPVAKGRGRGGNRKLFDHPSEYFVFAKVAALSCLIIMLI